MNISQVIQFEGPPDTLIWKSPIEDFNTTSQLIVDETHEALLVVNGNACDLFGPGRHTLETPNIPIVKRIINIPTDGQTPFPCKVFFINKVHQMDIMWGIPGEITLNDPIYDIFLHVGMCGNMNFLISDARKFMLKIVGFRDSFDSDDMVAKFRGIIKQYVKSYISKIMNVGKVSYFDMNENLFDVSNVVKEQLIPIFADYGIDVLEFNIETITVPDEDFEAVKKAKEARASRVIQGYTWQEERQMDIAQTFAGNEGAMGNIGGAMGGMMMGSAMSGTVAELARNALSQSIIPNQAPPKDLRNMTSPIGGAMNIQGFFANQATAQAAATKEPMPQTDQPQVQQPQEQAAQPEPDAKFCIKCGNRLSADMLFCPKCGTRQAKECPNCHTQLMPDAAFCHKCGTPC